MKKRILSMVLAICLVLSCVPITVFAANADTTDLQNLLNGGKTVKLTQDYNIDATLTVSNTVTLDLNGHVIKMTNNNGLITVNSGGALTLKDSNNTATHTDKSLPVGGVLTGGNSEKYGGVQVKSGATFNMNGGTIYNCTQSDVSKGGGGVCSFGNFTINGGTIENCTAGRYGGGIYIDSGSFTMNGGTIEKCSSGYGGGGILAASGSFTMNGGTIENCSAYYGEAVYTLRGMPVVANGGIIKGIFHLAPSATITTDITKGYTKFYGEIQNHGTINSGVFYGGIQNISSGRIRNTYHTVSFDLNGGSGSAPTQYFVDIDTVPALKPDNPTREGYQFRGWLNGDNGYAFSNPVTNSVNLTAKWALSSVSTEAELLQAVSEGSSEIKLVDDIKLTSMLDLTDKVITLDLNGHVLSAQTPLTDFIYLYASKSAPYYNALLILIDSNPTATHTDSNLPLGGVLSCVISLNVEDGCTYSSTLSANGGTVTGRVGLNHDNTYINYTSDDAPPTAFTSSNNSIHGRIFGGIYYNTLRESLINGNTVTFMDGDSTYAKEVVTNKAAYAPVEPTKDGYVFAGWYNGSTKYEFPQTITSDITLTAKWVEAATSESTLINAINEGINPIKLMADINLSSTLDLTDKNITLDLNGYVLTGNIQLADTSASPDSILTFIDSRPTATHSDSSLPAGGVVKGNITLTRGNGSVSHLYANGGTVTGQTSLPSYVGGIFCTSDTPTAFKAYVGNYGEIHGGIFYAGINESCIKENTVTFMNGSSRYALEVVASGNKVVAPIAPPVKEGYNSFDGWYNGDAKYTFGSTISESITLTAKFSNPKTYNISYNLGGGTATNATSYTVESGAIMLNNPTKTGYTFTGWSGTGLTGENNMTVTIVKGSTGDRAYTAHFSQNSYTVKFDTVDGSSISDKKGVKWTDKVLDGITPPTKDGYEFTGWKCGDMAVNANTKYSDLAANDTVTSVTLVAQWKDITAPTGEISVGTNKWNTFLNTITFGLFFKDTQSVTITAGDNSGEDVTIEYLLSDKELTVDQLNSATFNTYNDKFSINPDNKYVIYAKLTDTSGNVAYINSEGIVLDATVPVISGIENGKTYCEVQTVTVTEDYIESVKVNGIAVTLDANNQFVLSPADGTQTIVVTDKAKNETTITVTVNDGHTYEWQDENGQYWQKCKYCGYETAKKDIPTFTIDAPDTVCRTQDCEASVTLPDGINNASLSFEFIGLGGAIDTTVEDGKLYGDVTADGYPDAENSFNFVVYATTDDGFPFTVSKTVQIQNEHAGGQATYFKKAICKTCNEEYGSLLTDTTTPTGEITVGTNKWNSFLNTITFGLFFKDTQSVTITATDDSYDHAGYTDDKAVKVEYYLYSGDTALTQADLAGLTFTAYNGTFNINPDNKYVVYVRLTDHAGNVTYISSEGVVLDATAPAITGVTDGSICYTTQKAVVADENLKSVTLNGVSIDGTTVTLDGNKDAVYTIVATDKSGNSTTVTVTMKPISSLAESIDGVNGENVNSSDKEKIDSVKENVSEVDTSNATDSEKEALNGIDERCNELLDIIDKAQEAIETENIKNAEGISPDNVTKDDREALDNAKADFEKAIEDYGSNYTDDETANIELDLERIDESLKVLDDVKAVEDLIAKLPESVEPDDLDTVQSILNASDAYNALTDYEKSLVSKEAKEKLYTLTAGISAYMVYEGNGGLWTIGQSGALTFTANGAYSKFTGIKVDGVLVDAKYYTAKSGSTIISLNADYLNTLSAGTHTLTVLYTDGEAEAEFEVVKQAEAETEKPNNKNKNTSKQSPETGNDINSAMWLMLLLSCGGAIIVTSAYGKRKKQSR